MKLYIMKKEALETFKNNLSVIYAKYYTEPTNKWMTEVYGEDPFIEFKEIPDFELAPLDSDLSKGEIDLLNCKIIFEKLMFLSESQACDERLWAGLTNGTFYDYMRRRWGYGYGKKPKTPKADSGEIKTRFFYDASGRGGFYRNTLSKCWWVGHNTYDPQNTTNHFEKLDVIGSNDISTKISEIFRNFTFSSNPYIFDSIVEALRYFNEEGKQLSVRNHIRPALSFLNAVGGAVILDCIDQDTIKEIVVNAIESIMQGDEPSLSVDAEGDNSSFEEEDDEIGIITNEANPDSQVTEVLEDEDDEDQMKVILGSRVMVRNSSGKLIVYKFDYVNGTLPAHMPPLEGLSIGDTYEHKGEEYRIEDISI